MCVHVVMTQLVDICSMFGSNCTCLFKLIRSSMVTIKKGSTVGKLCHLRICPCSRHIGPRDVVQPLSCV